MNKKIRILFDRYHSGKATQREKELVEKWYQLNNETDHPELSEDQKNAVYQKLESGVESFLPARTVRLYPFKPLIRVAAILLMLSFTFIAYHYYARHDLRTEITYTVTRTGAGEKKQITLPDQSVIFLNAGTELAIPSDFGNKKRELVLTGEAFFKIHRDTTRPFIIHSGKIITTVLGTSFNIKAYRSDKNIEVSVATGKVKVELKQANGQLTGLADAMVHNQQLLFDKNSNTHIITSTVTDEVSSWRTNSLYFENLTLEEMAVILERTYKVTISLPEDKNKEKYTLHFNNEPLNKVLPVICSFSSLNFEINKNKVTLTQRK